MVRNYKIITILLALILVLGISTLALANDDLRTDDIIGGIRDSSDNAGLMGDGLKDTGTKLMNDIFNIVRIAVIGLLIIKTFSYIGSIQGAADNPQEQRILKRRLLFSALGILLALNFWRIYAWISTISINIGS